MTKEEKDYCMYKLGLSGSFMNGLINIMHQADHNNQDKLSMGWPDLMKVVLRYQNENGYWQNLAEEWNKENPHHIIYP